MNSSQALIRQIVAHMTCAVCGHHFGMRDIMVLGRRDQMYALQVRCRACRAQSVIFATVNDGGAAEPIYTDLLPEEWDRFKDATSVTANDVISVHSYLQAYDDDFSDILEEPLPEEDAD